MSKIENNLEKFKSLLEPITKNMTYGKKDFLNKLFAEIIFEVNIMENEMNKVKAKANGLDSPEEYVDVLGMSINLLQAFGFSAIDFIRLKKDIIQWIIHNNKDIKKELTYKSFTATYKWVNIFQLFNSRMPENIEELKKYIQETNND